MDDRELLEFAAKAVGISGVEVDSGINIGSDSTPVIWNPLTDDGDALRMAVKLGITDLRLAVGELVLANDANGLHGCDVVRRAIVRAAAEIGKKMK